MVNKIRSISKKLISLPRNRRIERLPANYKVVHDYEDEEVYEPDYEQGKESKKESIYDKYKVNNEHNEIEEQARKNMEGSADRSESSILSNGEKDFQTKINFIVNIKNLGFWKNSKFLCRKLLKKL